MRSLTSLNRLTEKGIEKTGSCLPVIDALRSHLLQPDVDQQVASWLKPLLEQALNKVAATATALHLPQPSTAKNSRIDKQPRFATTKLKTSKSAIRMAKPTALECAEIQEVLSASSGSEVVAHVAFDHQYAGAPTSN